MPDKTIELGSPELAALTSAPDLPVRQVLARLNQTPDLFQLVIDAEARLLGTVTDGDIRRALLRGATLDDKAETCMHRAPATGRIGDPAAVSERTRTILTYALCGFCNFASIGIQIGGIGGMAPTRRAELAQLGLRAMLGGALACSMTACVAGVFV